MQNLRKLNIFQIYAKLPFVLYKSTYLVPQRPFPTTPTDPLTSHLEEFAQAKLLDFLIDTSADKTVQKSIQNDGSAKKTQSSQYEKLLSEYISFYILPLYKAQRGSVALSLYARHNFNDSALPQDGEDRITKKQISQRFLALPIEERWPYQLRAESIIAANKIKFQAYNKLFEVPKAKVLRPLHLYLRQRKIDKQQKKMNEISLSQKKRLAQLSIKLKDQDKRTLSTFLQEYSLTIPQFNIIKDICDKTSERLQLQKEYMNGQKQYQKLLKNGNRSRAQAIKKDNQKMAKDIQKLSAFIINLPKEQLKACHQVISLPSKPLFKRQPFQQLQIQLQHEKAIQLEKAKEIKETKAQKLADKTIQSENSIQSIERPTQQAERPTLLQGINISSLLQPSSNANDALIQQTQPIENSQYQKILVAVNEDEQSLEQNQQEAQLKDENLNDMEIIEDDYQVLKLNRLIAKAGKPKIPVKKYVY